MEDQRYAVVRAVDNFVVNVVMWNGDTGPDGWHPPEGCFTVQSETLDIGETYVP